MNIYEKLAAITAELETVAKNLEVVAGKGKYKAVSERDIIDAVKPLEAKYGVYSYPADREIIEQERLESTSEYNGKTTVKTTFYLRVKTVYRFVDIEKPTDYIETVTYADGMDAGDKGTGKAMTYGDKYALMKAYKISTGEDPDQSASVETHYTELASDSERKMIFDLCRDLGVNYADILRNVGWKEGEKLTKEQYVKAVKAMQGISEK